MNSRKDLLMYNADGYYDPTAGFALKNAEKKMPNGYVRWFGQPIYMPSRKMCKRHLKIAHSLMDRRMLARKLLSNRRT